MTRSGVNPSRIAPTVEAGGPIISVIVPTYNRPRALAMCLRALAAQTLAHDRFEVIVCDDGSSVAVRNQQQALLARLNGALHIKLMRQPNAGPAAARNLGAACARGQYLAFTDDDCEPEPDWLEQLVARFELQPDVLVGGRMRNGVAADSCAAASQAIMDFVYTEYWRRAGARLFSTSNLSLPASAFREIGGFSQHFPDAAGEDYDLCWRWQESGRGTEYAPEAAILHCHEFTLADYVRQHFRYGRGLLRVRLRRRARKQRKQGPGLWFYVRLVVHPLYRQCDLAALRCAALIAMSQLATAAGAAVEFVFPSRRGSARHTRQPTIEGSI